MIKNLKTGASQGSSWNVAPREYNERRITGTLAGLLDS
jgi:hypothetical protein